MARSERAARRSRGQERAVGHGRGALRAPRRARARPAPARRTAEPRPRADPVRAGGDGALAEPAKGAAPRHDGRRRHDRLLLHVAPRRCAAPAHRRRSRGDPLGGVQRLTSRRSYANNVLAVLTTSYVVNYLDRYLLSMLAGPVQREFGISDATMGLLLGPAFALFYSGLAVPVAWLADRRSRRSLIAAGMLVWSAFTAVAGLAQSSLHVAIARIGVGIGQSAGAAPAHSLVVDYFPPERRATALSILQMGITIGQMLGMLVGGLLVVPLGWRNVLL